VSRSLVPRLIVCAGRHEDQRPQQLRPPRGQANSDESAHRKSGEMNGRSQMIDELRGVLGDRVHIVAAPGNARSAVTAMIVRDDPIPAGEMPKLFSIRVRTHEQTVREKDRLGTVTGYHVVE
jgi:hypothetical protein